MIRPHRVVGGLLGLAVGDALGVPVEFESREQRREDPVRELRGGGVHDQPPGTWSDDTALTFCTVEALLGEYSLERLGGLFAGWLQEGRWTARGEVFDVGETTRQAIERIIRGVSPQVSGSIDESSNGNGSLMRILPVALAFSRWSIPLMLDRVHEASRITHAHTRSQMACGILSLIVRNLVFQRPAGAAYRYAMEDAVKYYAQPPWRMERRTFSRILRGSLADVPADEILSGGHVTETIEAAVWSLVTTRNYRDCVVKAVNLGGDTDTVAAIAGGLAGIAHGIDTIPKEWLDSLARKDELLALANRFAVVLSA
ncbi:MAG: ADP-ribosylglycohydrolase family protein [Candidatus Eisenbacteria bacterium]|nr:ADP-ribosylglycohydrolase family protein [Candidatus Eisenbacteria bacterium]